MTDAGATARGPDAPVVAIDGPAASGKGTIAWSVAQALGFHYLDSGSLYRLIALRALERQTALGLLPEQVTRDGEPAWVVPLGWSHAMFLLAARPELALIRGGA